MVYNIRIQNQTFVIYRYHHISHYFNKKSDDEGYGEKGNSYTIELEFDVVQISNIGYMPVS